VVFYDQGESQYFLISDIDFKADFRGVTKTKSCGSCTGGCGSFSPGEGRQCPRAKG